MVKSQKLAFNPVTALASLRRLRHGKTVPWNQRMCSSESGESIRWRGRFTAGRQCVQELIVHDDSEAIGRRSHSHNDGAKGCRHGHRPQTCS